MTEIELDMMKSILEYYAMHIIGKNIKYIQESDIEDKKTLKRLLKKGYIKNEQIDDTKFLILTPDGFQVLMNDKSLDPVTKIFYKDMAFHALNTLNNQMSS